MIKQLLFAAALSLGTLAVNAQSFTFSFTPGYCFNNTATNSANAIITSTASGATSYSWTINGGSCNGIILSSAGNGSQVSFAYPCCGVFSITCSAYNGSTFLASTTNSLVMICPPSMTISTPNANNICAGTTVTMSPSGTSYTSATWSGGLSGSTVYVTPTVSTCYTLTGTGVGGCSASTTKCFSLMPAANAGVNTPQPFCLGGSVVLTPSGGVTYTLIPGNVSGSNFTVSPTVNTCYSVIASNGTCTGMAQACVTVNPLPVVTVNTVAPMCIGGTATLTVTGAATYTWSNSASSQTIVVSPFASTCYSVIGTNAFNCSGMAVTCVSVQSGPSLTVSPSMTVCAGTSTILSAGGANSYTWSTNATTSTISVLPATITMYTVYGSNTAACVAAATVIVQPLNSCAIVWPGDANSDGVVDGTDVLELGLYATSTGASRSPGGNAYTGQFAIAWTGTGSNSQNKAHVDCNGDGTVNQGDTLAIYNNYSLTHTFRETAPSSSGDITLVGPAVLGQNSWCTVDIMLGSTSNNMNNIYGVVFDLTFNNSIVDNNMAYVKYIPSFLNAGNQNIPFRRIVPGSGIANCVTVRVDGNNVSGNGKIGEFTFKHRGPIGPMNLSVSNVKMINKAGTLTALGGSTTSVNFVDATGLAENTAQPVVAAYPVPASSEITLTNSATGKTAYTITDITGRIVSTGSFEGKKNVDVSAFAPGTYIVAFESNGQKAQQRLLIEH